MSNNFLQFSTQIALRSEEEADWFHTILDGHPPDAAENARPKWALKLLKKMGETTGNDPQDGYCGSHKITLVKDEKGKVNESESNVWFYSEEGDEPYHVALIIQAFLKKFYPKNFFTFTWSMTCDKMRPDEFSGGFAVIHAKKITIQTAEETAKEVRDEMKESLAH
jgi:hypothetical protein